MLFSVTLLFYTFYFLQFTELALKKVLAYKRVKFTPEIGFPIQNGGKGIIALYFL